MRQHKTHLISLWRLARLPLFVYIGLLIALIIFEDQFVFQPEREVRTDVGLVLDDRRNRFINVAEHKIHLLAVERPNPRCFALYFHGNGGNINHRMAILERLASELNITVLGVSYSGYGYSEGKPSESQIQHDAEAALAYILEQYAINKMELMVFGESLGGAVATRLASEHCLPLIALDSTFASLDQVAAFHYPWIPVRYLMKNRFTAEEHARNYHGTVIQTHGTDDEIVPFESGQQLATQFPNQELHQFIIRKGGRHNEVPSDHYFRVLNVAINSVFKTKTE